MNLDPGLVGVVIGSLLSLVGNIATQWFSTRKEEKQWQREQDAEVTKQMRDDENQRIENIRNIYHNCIRSLSIIQASKSEGFKISDDEIARVNQEAFEWLSMLSLHHNEVYGESIFNFHTKFKNFLDRPNFYSSTLLNEVYELAMLDKTLFPQSKIKNNQFDDKKFKLQLEINRDYIRKKMIEGVILKDSYTLDFEISQIKESHRKKIWDLYSGIPQRIILSLPSYNKEKKMIEFRASGPWKGRVNPNEESLEEIFDEWEKDYDIALKIAKDDLEANADSTN